MEKLTKKERKELARLERLQEEQKARQKALLQKILLWGSVTLLLVGSVVGLSFLVNPNGEKNTIENLPPVTKNDITIGNPSSKVVIVEYSDFQCPGCAALHPIIKQVLTDYKDKVLYVYRFFPLSSIHKNAMISSQFAYAAQKQGKFQDAMNILFENQNSWGESNDTQNLFINYANTLQLDLGKYLQDLNADDTKAFIEKQQSDGITIGVSSTPTVFLNGKQIKTPRNYDELKLQIDEELSKTQ